MRTQCFFLAYRRKRSRRSVNWRKPTGGLVMKPARIVEGYPVSDFRLAGNILEQRYHCGPGEELVIAEVFEAPEMRVARKLCNQWKTEEFAFKELMDLSFKA